MPLTGVTTRTVTASYRKHDGSAVAGKVTFRPSVRLVSTNDDQIPPLSTEATLDSSGDLSVTLATTDDADLSPSGWTWTVREHIEGAHARTFSMELPAGVGSVDLADVAPLDPVDPSATYVLLADVALDDLADVDASSPTTLDRLGWDGAAWVPMAPSSGDVTSVNTQTGDVVLDAADVGADPAGTASGLITALKNGAPAGGDTLSELDARIAVVEALGSLATDAELIAAVADLIGTADTAGDTLGELQSLIGLRLLKSANLSDLANASTALTNLGLSANGKSLVTAADYAAMLTLLDALSTADASGTYEPLHSAASQAEMEAGTETALRSMSPLRVAQAIAALASGGGLTQEQAEDIVALLIDDNSDLDWTYDDPTASLVAAIKSGAVTNAMLAGSIALSKLATDPLARANHTGTQAISTVTNLQSTLDAKLPVFNIANYGATTGSSDNTAAVQAAIAAAYAAGGGTVYFPNGTFVCTGQLTIPGGVSAGQVAITFEGSTPQGIAMANIEASEPNTGSVLDLTFSDAGASGKIVALYEGVFGLKNIRIGCSDSTKDDTPLVYVTLPQPRFEAVTFFGNTTHRTTACLQDAIVFGGTGTSHVENSTSSAFSGYGGFVRECAFWAIRKHVLMQNWCDGVVVEGCITDRSSCGSSETNSAPYVIDSGGTSASFFAMGNVFQNNTIEVERYNYAFRFKNNAKNNVIRGNGIWDPLGGQTLGLAYVEESSGCTNNWLRFDGYTHASFQNLGGITVGAGSNMVEKQGTQSPTTLFEYKPANWQMFFNGTTNGNQSLIYDSTIDGPMLAGNNGVGIRSAGRNQKIGIYAGSGTPEGVVTAAPGSIYGNVAGGASTALYVKESGSGNTGWVAYGAPGGGSVSDTAYDATTWDGVTSTAPSKNAVRDLIESILDGVTFTGDVVVPDEAYDATAWNGSLEVPTKNAVRDKIESLGGGTVDDTAYDATSWDGVTTTAPSKNAVRDKVETLAPKASPALTGTPTAPTAAQGTNTTQVATTEYVQTEVGLLVPKSLFDANTILIATSDNTPIALSVAASRILGRKAAGDIDDMTTAELAALFGTPDGTKYLADDGTLKTPTAAVSLTNSSNYVTSDVTMTTANTYYDGPSLSLAAGTWLLTGAVHILASTNAFRNFFAKLWDGTTIKSTGVYGVPGTAGAGQGTIYLSGIVTPGSTTTYKISATSTVNGDTLRGTSSTGSYLNAVKIA